MQADGKGQSAAPKQSQRKEHEQLHNQITAAHLLQVGTQLLLGMFRINHT